MCPLGVDCNSRWALIVTAGGRCRGCAVFVGIVVHYTRLYINGGIMGVLFLNVVEWAHLRNVAGYIW